MTLRDAAPTSRAMVVTVMVWMVAFLDSTVINLALPANEHDLGGGLALQQWIIDGYLLAMAAAILPGGSISDLFGRVPVMRFGLLAFGAASVLAAVATSPAMLITARLIQGLGAVLSSVGLQGIQKPSALNLCDTEVSQEDPVPGRVNVMSFIKCLDVSGEGSCPFCGVNDDGRRFLQELPTQRRKDYARANTSITHRPDPWRDRRLVRRVARALGDH